MKKICALLLILLPGFYRVTGQEAVFFYTRDSTRVRADLYLADYRLPFIILCHQQGSDRTEFKEIAPRLLNVNYNCLAIDLRPGIGLSSSEDILAAIQYAGRFGNQPVILMGTAFSAALCFLIAAENAHDVKAIIALNPGEYLQPVKSIGALARQINQPIFVSSTLKEFPYVANIFSGIPESRLTVFKPQKGPGIRGTAAFSNSNPDSSEYWFALMMFFKKIDSK
jgi:pimeloyl-ACP methyl ester carboxylesterase